MYELIQAGENTFYIDCPAKIGVFYTGGGHVWLVDSGGDKDAARRILKILAGRDWTLDGIVNTHSNADHIGGNQTLQKRTGCAVISTSMENALIRHPLLEPSFLYGGYPLKGLRGKFLLAQESIPTGTVPEDLPAGLSSFPLGGHFFDMCGVRTPDGVAFIADSVFSEETINKYHFFFLYDVAAFLETLDALEQMDATLFVPSHAAATGDIRPLAGVNRNKVYEIIGLLLDLTASPKGFDEILSGCFDKYALTMDLGQYALVGSTVKSYLAYLCDKGDLLHEIDRNRLLYRRI